MLVKVLGMVALVACGSLLVGWRSTVVADAPGPKLSSRDSQMAALAPQTKSPAFRHGHFVGGSGNSDYVLDLAFSP